MIIVQQQLIVCSKKQMLSIHHIQPCLMIPYILFFVMNIFISLLIISTQKVNEMEIQIYKFQNHLRKDIIFEIIHKFGIIIFWQLTIRKFIIQIIKQFQMMEKLEHPYCGINLKKDKSSYIYDTVQVQWGQLDNYSIIKKVGRGKYSHVFQGIVNKSKKHVAIKVLNPIKPQKIKRQYHILKQLNHPNIIKLVDIVRCSHLRTASLILEYVDFVDFRQLYPKLTLSDIKCYMGQLFNALDYMHSNGIMHRDIKPHNVPIDHHKKTLKVIDLGLSQYYFPTNQNNTHVASLYYKAPELLFGNSQYDYRVDCWAAGLILAGMIFKKTPFIQGHDQVDQILKLSKLLGTKEVVSYIKQYRLTEKKSHRKDNICFDILVAFENGDVKPQKPSTFEEFEDENNKDNITWQSLDLIRKLLTLDYKKRFTAKQALSHPFFD